MTKQLTEEDYERINERIDLIRDEEIRRNQLHERDINDRKSHNHFIKATMVAEIVLLVIIAYGLLSD